MGTPAAGATTLGVGTARTGAGASTTPISTGDLLLVIQMQGAEINSANNSTYGSGNLTTNLTAGQYEYVVAASGVNTGVTPNSVTLSTALKNTYTTSAVGATATLRTFQVVRVPQYSSLTLTGTIMPAAWNGSTGGVVALDVAGALNFNNNTINASGAGFRGGGGRGLTTSNGDDASVTTSGNAATDLNAQKGKGTGGHPPLRQQRGTLLDRGADGYPAAASRAELPATAAVATTTFITRAAAVPTAAPVTAVATAATTETSLSVGSWARPSSAAAPAWCWAAAAAPAPPTTARAAAPPVSPAAARPGAALCWCGRAPWPARAQ